MSEYEVVGIREETAPERAQDDWFAKQVLESPTRLEEAARLLIGLVTGLLGVLFTVLSVTKDPLPPYMKLDVVRGLGVGVVGFLLLALLAALGVVMPWRWTYNPSEPESQAQTFAKILNRKSWALSFAATFFGVGIILLSIVLFIALSRF